MVGPCTRRELPSIHRPAKAGLGLTASHSPVRTQGRAEGSPGPGAGDCPSRTSQTCGRCRLSHAQQTQQHTARQGCGAPDQSVLLGWHRCSIHENCRPPGFGRGIEGQKEQHSDPQQGQHSGKIISKAPGGEGGGVGYPQDGYGMEYQRQPDKKLVPQQPAAFISKNLTQGSNPPPSARRHLKILGRSDRDTWGPVPG